MRALAEKHLAGACGLLEPRCDVDDVPGHEAVARGRIAGHDLSGGHADPGLDPYAEFALELVAERSHRIAELCGGPHGSERVVLVEPGDAEDGHHRVADELLHRPTVSLDRDTGLVEVPADGLPDGLRVDPLA